jgi:hypothetical protein
MLSVSKRLRVAGPTVLLPSALASMVVGPRGAAAFAFLFLAAGVALLALGVLMDSDRVPLWNADA